MIVYYTMTQAIKIRFCKYSTFLYSNFIDKYNEVYMENQIEFERAEWCNT